MGCCLSKDGDSRANQLSRWRSTGIVALRDSKLKTFPSEVLELQRSVRTLDLTNNKLVVIPTEIECLTNIQRLILVDNLIESLPMTLGSLRSLKFLNLDGNRLTTLPHQLGLLARLEQLSIRGSLLESLPDTIGNLQNLILLNISENKLQALPDSIGSCRSLEELQANGNFIEVLPASICNLIRLKSLALNENNLSELPPRLLKDCGALQSISLHGNPLSMDQFQLMEGFSEFESRRRKKFDKQIDSNVMMNSSGLDEGVDL